MMKKAKNKIIDILIFVSLAIMSLSFIYPIFFMVINSFKTKIEYYINPFALPKSLNIDNYTLMISQFKILINLKNTLIIAIISVIFTIVFSVLASYAFTKLKFRFKNAICLIILATMFIPAQVTIIPLYVMFAKFHLVNTYTSVILSYIAGGLPGAILLLNASFRGISNETIEAAKIDGAGYFGIIRNVIIPMGIAAIAINIVMIFIGSCNDLFTAMILLSDMNKRTVMVALTGIMSRNGGDPSFQLTGLLISIAPPLLIYVVFQKYIVGGITAGAIK